MARNKERGNALIEFTLIGIPLIFVLISTFELARAMWTYETLAYATKEAARFAIVKGEDCVQTGNNCWITVGRLAQELRRFGAGLNADDLTITFRTENSAATIGPRTLATHLSDTTPWPVLSTTNPDYGSRPPGKVRIEATYPFRSVIAMFWPGVGPGRVYGAYTFRAQSEEQIQF